MTAPMTLQFWGVRGSVPTPGASTIRYGGNTACVSLKLGSQSLLVFDSGTGIRPLGQTLLDSDIDIMLLWSHAHWDHIQGLPFFAPLYQPHRPIRFFPTPLKQAPWYAALGQMDGVHFPVTPDMLQARLLCITEGIAEFFQERRCRVTRIATNHPGGGVGYRIEQAGRSLVYLTDNELDPPYEKVTPLETFVEFCQGADVLIHDAQYLPSDMPAKHGWGHSLVPQAWQLAAAAEVKHLILFHHDPERSDDDLDSIQETTRTWVPTQARPLHCTVAYEGYTVEL